MVYCSHTVLDGIELNVKWEFHGHWIAAGQRNGPVERSLKICWACIFYEMMSPAELRIVFPTSSFWKFDGSSMILR